MKSRQRIYVYNRKEISLFLLIFVLSSVFTFTLGLHLGKNLSAGTKPSIERVLSTIEELPDEAPNSHELAAPDKATQEGLEVNVKNQLKEEVIQTGLSVNQPKLLKLPHQPKSKNAGATSLSHPRTH
jgi:hypothetical protein